MSDTTVGRIVKEACKAIWDALKENGFLATPETTTQWRELANDFECKWNFPNCVGAIDGKHVAIQCPPKGGSLYFNYKKFHSLVLMAVVNANYQFSMVDVGDYGRLSDGSVFASSNLGYAINNNLLDLPPARLLPGINARQPYIFVGDDAFPLKTCLLKPYRRNSIEEREKIFNCRLSRACRIVENAFGIATSRFRVFRRSIVANVDTAVEVIKAVLALHNFLMYNRSFSNYNAYCPLDFVDREVQGQVMQGQWRTDVHNQALQDVSNIGSNNYSRDAKNVRDNYRDYFCSDAGSVPWQWGVVRSTSETFDEPQ